MTTPGDHASWPPPADGSQPSTGGETYGRQNPYGAVPADPWAPPAGGDPAPWSQPPAEPASDPYGQGAAQSAYGPASGASASDPYGQGAAQNAYGPASGASASDPYGQQSWTPAGGGAGQQPSTGGGPQASAPHPGAPAQPPLGAAERSSMQNRSIWLIVLGFLCGGTVPGILGIVALVQLDSNPASARQLLKVGWILFWVLFGLIVLFIIGYLAFMFLIMGVAMIPFLTGY